MRTLPAMWISADESLPEKGIAVLGFRDADPHWGNAAYGMAWREIDDESKPGLRWNESGRPTHWMRLPAPPRDEAPYSVMLWVTDAEREAIKVCESDYSDNDMDAACWQIAATLRGLLERLGGER